MSGSCSRAAKVTVRHCFGVKPLSRPATTKLAASRFTSHSKGPRMVSSKSLMSKTRTLRRGVRAKVRQVRIAAQLSVQTRRRRGSQVGGHHQRCPSIESEGRHQHPAVPDRHQFRDPGLVLAEQQPNRVAWIGRRELRMGLQRNALRAAFPTPPRCCSALNGSSLTALTAWLTTSPPSHHHAPSRTHRRDTITAVATATPATRYRISNLPSSLQQHDALLLDLALGLHQAEANRRKQSSSSDPGSRPVRRHKRTHTSLGGSPPAAGSVSSVRTIYHPSHGHTRTHHARWSGGPPRPDSTEETVTDG